MGEAKNAVPPYTWSGTRPGIIITANLLPSMLGAGMHGNVRGRAAGASGGSWAWFDVFLTGETFPNKSWRAWWASGKSCTALKRKKKRNPE